MSPNNPIAAAVARYHGDPHYLVQMLHAAQDKLGWISRGNEVELAERLGIPVTRVEAVVKFYSFFYDRPRGQYRVLFSDNITDRMAGNQALFQRMLDRFRAAARRDLGGWAGQRRSHLLHRHVRSGSRAARERRRGHPARRDARRRDRGTHPGRRADRALAGRVLPHRGQCAPPRPAAFRAAAARRRARRRDPARPAGADRRNEALEPARPRRRRLSDRPQMGERAQRAGRRALHRLQRRRGRARHVQGPRAADLACGPRVRGHGDRRLCQRRDPRPSLSARRIRIFTRTTRGRARAHAQRAPPRPGDPRRRRLRFRHRDPSRRRRLCLRRGIGADRIAGGQAGTAAHPAAVPGHARAISANQLSSTMSRRSRRRRSSRSKAARATPGAARASRPAQKSCQFPATASAPASTNTNSA